MDNSPADNSGLSEKGAYNPINNEKMNQNTTPAAEDAPALVKKIGRTTYIVKIHFSETSKETMSDKIKRMLKNEIRQM